jgi:DNA repair protein RadC
MRNFAFETTIKYVRRRPKNEVQIKEPEDAVNFIRPFFKECIDHHEEFYAIFLDRAHQIISCTKLGMGGVAGTLVNKLALYQQAILSNCTAVILVHNHPSGNLAASDADIKITREIKEKLKIFDINVLDHIILTHSGFSTVE